VAFVASVVVVVGVSAKLESLPGRLASGVCSFWMRGSVMVVMVAGGWLASVEAKIEFVD